jgi:hypothetical protein
LLPVRLARRGAFVRAALRLPRLPSQRRPRPLAAAARFLPHANVDPRTVRPGPTAEGDEWCRAVVPGDRAPADRGRCGLDRTDVGAFCFRGRRHSQRSVPRRPRPVSGARDELQQVDRHEEPRERGTRPRARDPRSMITAASGPTASRGQRRSRACGARRASTPSPRSGWSPRSATSPRFAHPKQLAGDVGLVPSLAVFRRAASAGRNHQGPAPATPAACPPKRPGTTAVPRVSLTLRHPKPGRRPP